MIHTKKIFLKFLIFNISFMIFANADEPTNEGFRNCIDGMIDKFGIVTEGDSPIKYIKLAISFIMIGDEITPDVMDYYRMFSKQALSTRILLQDNFCNSMKRVFSIGPFSHIRTIHSDCMNDINHFGDSKDDILENAIYYHRVESDERLATKFRHFGKRLIDEYGVLYLRHIRDVTVIDPESKLVDAWSYCVNKYPDENQENAKIEGEASTSQLEDSVDD